MQRSPRWRFRAGTALRSGAVVVCIAAATLSCTRPSQRTDTTPAPDAPTSDLLTSLPATAPPVPVHPFGSGLRGFIAQREGSVSAAAYDFATGTTYTFGGDARVYTASIVKVAVLASLLRQHPEGLSRPDQLRARKMIEQSDNDATTTLWRAQGSGPGLFALFRAAGMSETVPAPVLLEPWDGVRTTAVDQVTLLRHIVDGSLLSAPARHFELRLMRSVAPDEAWGVSAGAGLTWQVALKNGWLPIKGEGWTINSVGIIDPNPRPVYCLAVLSAGDPSMAYGIRTVDLVAQHVNAALG